MRLAVKVQRVRRERKFARMQSMGWKEAQNKGEIEARKGGIGIVA
jgi:hypothetical protein